jgi:hypothetical protein
LLGDATQIVRLEMVAVRSAAPSDPACLYGTATLNYAFDPSSPRPARITMRKSPLVIDSKLPRVGTTIFTVMSKLAAD